MLTKNRAFYTGLISKMTLMDLVELYDRSSDYPKLGDEIELLIDTHLSVLARWPGQVPAPKDMEMKVADALSAIRADISDDPVSGLVNS